MQFMHMEFLDEAFLHPEGLAGVEMAKELVTVPKCKTCIKNSSFDAENRKLKRKLDNAEASMTKDQFYMLTNNVKRVKRWSDKSITDGLHCKFSCGSTAYELERKKWFLPSGRTLRERFQAIHFESGILEEIFVLFSHKVPSMQEGDKNCAVIFDEMAIQPGINYCNNLEVCRFPTMTG
ncbi:uncharacterized protein LOC134220775 [Armigeres subalbatus]|uniref:uncharacterized protein LOC134220775 n=1 Tax=Armigeres subalbatus TaxID=124917 RepID=UPI002ED12F90